MGKVSLFFGICEQAVAVSYAVMSFAVVFNSNPLVGGVIDLEYTLLVSSLNLDTVGNEFQRDGVGLIGISIH